MTKKEKITTVKIKSKAIPVTGCGRLQGCEMLRITHCLGNWLTDGTKVVSLVRWLHSTPQKLIFSVSGNNFYYSLNKPPHQESNL
jgi:hypothetical protein